MEQPNRPPLLLVLRRFENEIVELHPASASPAAASDPAAAACRIGARPEGDTQVYHVVLPDSLVIRPVDWRRFAYDHAKVAELVSTCVRDNMLALSFAPWSEEEGARVEAFLSRVLVDLSSVFDLESVRCESEEAGRLLCTVAGAHKNGQRASYCVDVTLL